MNTAPAGLIEEFAAIEPLFTIRLTGEGVRPHLVAASDLAELLIAAEQTVAALARREHPDMAEDFVLSLSAMRDESIGFAFTSSDPAVATAAYRELLTAVENRLFRGLPARSVEGLRVLTGFAREHHGRTEFWSGSGGAPLLELDSQFVLEVPLPSYVRGETVLYGKVERVGGVSPRVRLRVGPQQVVYGDLDEELARILGERLYRHVALRGQATWDQQDGSIVYFRVEGAENREPAPIRQTFRELRAAAGEAFDDIDDIDAFAQRVREGEAP